MLNSDYDGGSQTYHILGHQTWAGHVWLQEGPVCCPDVRADGEPTAEGRLPIVSGETAEVVCDSHIESRFICGLE